MHMIDVGVWWVFHDLRQVETHDRRIESYGNYTEKFNTSILLDYHYILLGIIGGLWNSLSIILMIDNPWWAELKLFQHIEKSFDNTVIGIAVYLIIR